MSDRNTSKRSGDNDSKNEASTGSPELPGPGRDSSWRGQRPPAPPRPLHRSASRETLTVHTHDQHSPIELGPEVEEGPQVLRAEDDRTPSSGSGNMGWRRPPADLYRPDYHPGATMSTGQWSASLHHAAPPLSQISTAPSTRTAAGAPPLEAGGNQSSSPAQTSPSVSKGYRDWQEQHHLGDKYITTEEEGERARSQ